MGTKIFSFFKFWVWPVTPPRSTKKLKISKKGQNFQKMQFFTKISIFLVEFDVFLIYFRLLVNTGYDLTINMYLTGSKLKFLGLDTYFHQKSWFSLKLSFWAKSPQKLKKSPKSRKKMFQRTFSIMCNFVAIHFSWFFQKNEKLKIFKLGTNLSESVHLSTLWINL